MMKTLKYKNTKDTKSIKSFFYRHSLIYSKLSDLLVGKYSLNDKSNIYEYVKSYSKFDNYGNFIFKFKKLFKKIILN